MPSGCGRSCTAGNSRQSASVGVLRCAITQVSVDPKPGKAGTTELPSIPKELIDEFVKGPMSAEAVNAASMAFKKALIERALGAELSHHLGYPLGSAPRGPTRAPTTATAPAARPF